MEHQPSPAPSVPRAESAPPGERGRDEEVRELREKVREQAELLRTRDEQIKELQAQLKGITTQSPLSGTFSTSSFEKPSSGGSEQQAEDLPPLPVLLMRKASLADVQRKLQEEPSSINQRDASGQTPLMMACSTFNTDAEVVRQLLAAGADVCATDANGWNSLHYACMDNAHKDVIWLLLCAGADPTAPNLDGAYPLHYLVCRKAIEYDQPTMDCIRSAILCLLKFGVDINQPNRNGDTPLHLATMHDGYQVAQILLESGADPTITNGLGETVLHYAIMAKKKPLIEKLLEKGVDPRIPSADSVLELATGLGPAGEEIYNFLRAKISALDMKDMSPEEKKAYRRNLSIEELIVTEQKYINDLDVLIRIFLDPIKCNLANEENKTKILDEKEVRLIFGNVEEIFKVSKTLHMALRHEWKEALAAKRPPRVGQIFLDHMQALSEYEKLCNHQHAATESLNKALGGSTSSASSSDDCNSTPKRLRRREEGGERFEFAQFCEEARKNKECRQLDIASFLIKPFQRVTRYPLIFREIMSYMEPSDQDYRNLCKAYEEISKIIAKANEKRRVVDNFQVLVEIQNRIALPKGITLIKKERSFVHEGKFQISLNRDKYAQRLLFLFSDILVIAQPVKKKEVERSVHLHTIPLADGVLRDVKDGSNEAGRVARFAFSIQYPLGPVYAIVLATSEEEKARWMQILSTHIATEERNSKLAPSNQVFINLDKGGSTIDALSFISPLQAADGSSDPRLHQKKSRKSVSMIVRPLQAQPQPPLQQSLNIHKKRTEEEKEKEEKEKKGKKEKEEAGQEEEKREEEKEDATACREEGGEDSFLFKSGMWEGAKPRRAQTRNLVVGRERKETPLAPPQQDHT